MNWDVRLMPLRIFAPNASTPISVIVRCIDYAIARGVTIANNSYGGSAWSQALYDAFARARDAGVLMVVAAGNSHQDSDLVPMYPAAFDLDNIVSVAASTPDDALASFSNFGATSVDLAAPGVDILSTVPGGYGRRQGTSMATRHVTGAAALLASIHPHATAAWLKEAILSTAALSPGFAGTSVTGGSLDVAAAVRVTATTGGPVVTAPEPIIEVNRVAGTGATTVRLRWSASTSHAPVSFTLQRSSDGSTFDPVAMSPATSLTKTLTIDAAALPATFRVRGSTGSGEEGPWAVASPFVLRYAQESSPWITRTGT